MAGSIGYYILSGGESKFIDCMYMTVISLTSVGYNEVIPVSGNVSAQIFTMILITFSMGVILYALSTLTALVIEGELAGIFGTKKMEKQIKKLADHYIVCGGGETGRHVLAELVKNTERVVLIEHDQERIELCNSMPILKNLLHIKGDATDDQNLQKACIEKASGIIICLPSDKDAIYVTMTAKMLNDKIRIISKITDSNLAPKLKKAGAFRMVSPNLIGGLRMASEMIRPAPVDFIDSMIRSDRGNVRINELTVTKNSTLVGKKIMESGIKNKFNLIVLGARHDSEDIIFNPPPSYILRAGMTLIVMGKVDNIAVAKKMI